MRGLKDNRGRGCELRPEHRAPGTEGASGATDYLQIRRMRMKRVVSVLAAMAIMAAMLVAMAMPAFAKVKTMGNIIENCDVVETLTCSGTVTQVGGSKDSTFHGKSTADATIDIGPDENFGDVSLSGNNQGGGKGTAAVTARSLRLATFLKVPTTPSLRARAAGVTE
jgi:hypothetical protein